MTQAAALAIGSSGASYSTACERVVAREGVEISSFACGDQHSINIWTFVTGIHIHSGCLQDLSHE